MDKKEYAKWIDYISNNDSTPPTTIMDNYDDWKHRENAAKWLVKLKQFIPAIELFKTVIDIEPKNIEELEDKVWALWWLGISIWKETKNADEALKYTDMALKLAESTDEKLFFIKKGGMFKTRLDLLYESGNEEQANKEADEKISLTTVTDNESNSYLYFSYLFKSEIEHEKDDLEQTCVYLKKALDYFPHQLDVFNDLEEIFDKRQEDYEYAIKYMINITKLLDGVVWDI